MFLEKINYQTVTTASARQKLADLVNRVLYRGDRIILTRHGRPVAALVSMSDFSRLRRPDRPDIEQLMREEGLTAGQALARSLEEELKASGS
jgi:prevent-host-death family protein